MKNKFLYIIASLTALLMFGACSDFLDQDSPSKMTPGVVFENIDLANKAVLGVYDCLTEDATYSQDLSINLPSGTDIEIRTHSGTISSIDDNRKPAHYLADANNSKVARVWKELYKAIGRANLAIEGVEASEIYANPNNEYHKEMVSLRAEAIALRAMCYMELTRLWGNVPLMLVSAIKDPDIFKPKTDRMEIYEILIEQLIESAGDLPWYQITPERMGQGFARGLAARLALYRAGHDYVAEGRWVAPREDAAEWYKIAQEQCDIIMQSGYHDLEPRYIDYFGKQCRREYSKKETLYEIGFQMGGSSEMGYSIGVRYRAVTQAYGFTTQSTIATTPAYYYSFHPEDERRDISVVYYEYDDLKLEDNTTGVSRNVYSNTYDWRINKWSVKWMLEDFHKLSFTNKIKVGTGVNFPIMRYSDILLMYAEASAQINGGSPTQEAKEALWKVRSRAIPSMTESDFNSYLCTKTFQQAIEDERKWEFAGEGVRKYDLLRWGKLPQAIIEMREQNNAIVQDWTYDFEFPKLADGTTRHMPKVLYYKYDENFEDYDDVNIDYELDNPPSPAYIASDWIYKRLHDSSSGLENQAKAVEYWAVTCSGMVSEDGTLVQNGRPFQPIPAAVINDYNGKLKQDYGFVF